MAQRDVVLPAEVYETDRGAAFVLARAGPLAEPLRAARRAAELEARPCTTARQGPAAGARIAQKTEAAARERARHRARRRPRRSPARPRPASVPPRRASRKKPTAAGAPPPGFADFAAALRRVCAYVTDASDADLRAVYDGGGREARRAAATLGSACGPRRARGDRSGRQTRRTWRSDDGTIRPPASPLRGREDRATRRARSKRVARAARDSVDLLERLMGPASPESPTPAIDRAAAAALRRGPDDEGDGDAAASPVFEGEAFDAENPIDPLGGGRSRGALAGGAARPTRTTPIAGGRRRHRRGSSPGRPSRATTTLLEGEHPAGSNTNSILARGARGPRGARARCLLGTALLTPSRPPS